MNDAITTFRDVLAMLDENRALRARNAQLHADLESVRTDLADANERLAYALVELAEPRKDRRPARAQ